MTLATQLAAWREQSIPPSQDAGGFLQSVLGDSQRLFANHFVTKADVYLHSGVYPSIFDQVKRGKDTHLAAAASGTHPGESASQSQASENAAEGEPHDDHDHDHDHAEATDGKQVGAHADEEHEGVCNFLGKPRDWIDAFGRNFYPTTHTHLDEAGKQQEILPWLRIAAGLNPNEVQTFTLGAYWLRNRMGKVDEAEAFLREGWRANPNSYEILFELGRLKEENRHDLVRARNLMEAALQKWQLSEPGKEHPDEFTLMQIRGHLARIEERAGRLDQAIEHLEKLRALSPNPVAIQKQITDLRSRR